jgi:hypothetical protein
MIMNPQPTAFSPMLTALSDGDKRTIYHAALRVLAHTGMTLQHDDAVELLKDAGCQQDARWRSHHSRRPRGKSDRQCSGQYPPVRPRGPAGDGSGGPAGLFRHRLRSHVPRRRQDLGAVDHLNLKASNARRGCATPCPTSISLCPLPIPHEIDAAQGLRGKLCRHGGQFHQAHRQYRRQTERNWRPSGK